MLSCGRAPYPSGDDAHKRTFRQSKGKSVRHKRKKWRCLSETAGEASLAIFAGVTHPCQLSPTIFPGDATVSVGHRRPAQRNFTGDAAVTLPLREPEGCDAKLRASPWARAAAIPPATMCARAAGPALLSAVTQLARPLASSVNHSPQVTRP